MDNLSLDPQHQVRIGPWRGRAHIGQLASFTDQPLDPELLERCLTELRRRGYTSVVTSALPVVEQEPYLHRGFVVQRRLALLRHPLRSLPPRPGRPLRRARREDRATLLELDGLAFDSFWHLDATGFDEALNATPVSRLRVAGGSPPQGYAVTGIAGRRGYLQRLAVHPAAQGAGLGTRLVADALRWMVRRGATDALVNTQDDNTTTRRLYERLGFEDTGEQLAVLRLGPLSGE